MRALFGGAGDRLSPILVKELRQGVRGHLFTGAFLLQEFLVFCVVSLSLLAEGPGPRDASTFFFWAVVTVPLLLVLPLGAGVAISGEVAGNTLEPLLLTRLTAWRVVAGKWSATASQTLVLAIAVMPFVLMRYYLGAVEITRDLTFLGAYVACSLLLAGIAVAISPAPLSALFRWLLIAALSLTVAITFLTTMGQIAYDATIRAALPVSPSIAFALLLAVTVLASLEAGALQIAPPALARPARLRLLALMALGLSGCVLILPSSPVSAVTLVSGPILAAAVAIAAICEDAPLLPARYASFFKGRWRALFRLFLAPGWPAGVGFVIVVAIAAAASMYQADRAAKAGFVLGGVLGSLLMPVAIGRTLLPRTRPFLVLLIVTLVSFGLSTIAPIGLTMGSEAMWKVGCALLAFCPAAYAMARLGVSGDLAAMQLPPFADVLFVLVVTVVVALALLQAARAWRRIGGLMRGRLPA